MRKWNPIGSGRRAWAALRDLSRRWCLGVGAGPARRVAAKGFSPEAYRARQIMPKRPPCRRRADEGEATARRRSHQDQCAHKMRPQNSAANPLPGTKNSAARRYANQIDQMS